MISKFFYRLPISIQRTLGWRIRALKFHSLVSAEEKSFKQFNSLDLNAQKDFIFKKTKKIVLYAQTHNNFYKRFYKENQFDGRNLKNFEDLHRIPIVSKAILRERKSEWLKGNKNSILDNTGGTSGSTLNFFIDKKQLAKEKFYIEKIFSLINCRPKNTRIVFRGSNVLKDEYCGYDPKSDSYLMNNYKGFEGMEDQLNEIFSKRDISFIHGYPSAIYQFTKHLQKTKNAKLVEIVQKKIKGILYGSEYPAPTYRESIESFFNIPSISWYGHSEKVILASEVPNQPYIYRPFHTYGWVENVKNEQGSYSLIGTNYNNLDSPFIRYDSGDLISPIEKEEGILRSFKISEGRIGEFIYDKFKNPISLTALIFGRHHDAFNEVDFVQIHQEKIGYATLFITFSGKEQIKDINLKFDLSNVDIIFDFKIIKKPYRTNLGKVPLLILKR